MKSYDIFKVYIWLVQTIYRARRITLEEINEKWCETDMSGGVEFSRTTFVRHKNSIEEIFGIYIECDRKNGYEYYIGNRSVLEGDSVQNWMLNTLSVSNILTESMSLQDRILIEQIPQDHCLNTLIEAMKQSRKVEITYRSFGAVISRKHVFEPYALKAYRQRWYVLGHLLRPAREGETPAAKKGLPKGYVEYFRTFAFDRVEDITILPDKFKIDKNFDAKAYYYNCFGVMNDDMKPERVVVRAFENEVLEMRTLPLHHSQKEINTTDEYSDFELYLKPSWDFSGKLLSRGAWVEVLEPEWLRSEMLELSKQVMERYQKK